MVKVSRQYATEPLSPLGPALEDSDLGLLSRISRANPPDPPHMTQALIHRAQRTQPDLAARDLDLYKNLCHTCHTASVDRPHARPTPHAHATSPYMQASCRGPLLLLFLLLLLAAGSGWCCACARHGRRGMGSARRHLIGAPLAHARHGQVSIATVSTLVARARRCRGRHRRRRCHGRRGCHGAGGSKAVSAAHGLCHLRAKLLHKRRVGKRRTARRRRAAAAARRAAAREDEGTRVSGREALGRERLLRRRAPVSGWGLEVALGRECLARTLRGLYGGYAARSNATAPAYSSGPAAPAPVAAACCSCCPCCPCCSCCSPCCSMCHCCSPTCSRTLSGSGS